MEGREHQKFGNLAERRRGDPSTFTEEYLEEVSSVFSSPSGIYHPGITHTIPQQTTTHTWSNNYLQPMVYNPYPRFMRADRIPHHPGSREDNEFQEPRRTVPGTTSSAQSPSLMNSHRVTPFPYMEHAVTESTAIGYSPIASHHPDHDTRPNQSQKRQRTRCLVCLKTYARPDTLKVHMRIHRGERPYQCPRCFKTFSQSGNLYVHMRIHTGENPFACELCGKRLSQASGLQTHLKMHRRKANRLAARDEAFNNN